MIISISGMPGAGKSTVAKMLSKKLGMKRYYIGGMRRELARKKGMDIDRLNEIGEKESWTDKEVDEFQKELGKKEDNIIIEGRTSFFLIPQSLKVFLDVDLHTGAQRIFEDVKKNAERNEPVYGSVAEAEAAVRKRMEGDKRRYKKYYGVDIYDRSHYDIVIDTTSMTPEEVAGRILSVLKHRGK
ncbi:MAG: cytidylate kinase family protein [Candidatus Aenigmarchaeota archaeon]|nr:cytidylate kinase family protein [Candidatus Aenigmarchaeota archaeon]